MADQTPASPQALADNMLKSDEALAAVEQSVQTALANFMQTADKEISKLVQTNFIGPDVSSEMLKMQQATIDKTIKLINDGPAGAFKANSSSE
ncbi:hypothetical protein [Kordiimonas sp.]|uniref:hypothetical protein n=1 Tax=Kordiimonas sp. TaxID=1970157 RepID=UPI003A95091C